MTRLIKVEVSGISDVGPFGGAFTFERGLQVISAENNFGKSLAVTSIAWCLGLERMFGLQDNDSSRFPLALREVIDLEGDLDIPVTSSEAVLTLERDDGAQIRLRRAILGSAAEVVVEELDRRQLLLPVNDNYFCRFQPRPSSRSSALVSATTLG